MVSTRTARAHATQQQPPSRRANRDGPERRDYRHSGIEQLDSEAESDELGSPHSPWPSRSGSPPGGSPTLSSDDGELSYSSDDAQPRRYTQVEVDALVRNASDNAARPISRTNRQQASPRREERSYAKPIHPRRYDGDSKKLEAFIQHLEQNFAVYPRHYTTEAEKVDYAISHLGKQGADKHRAAPSQWVAGIRRSSGFPTFAAFKTALQKQYGDRYLADKFVADYLNNYQMAKGERVRD